MQITGAGYLFTADNGQGCMVGLVRPFIPSGSTVPTAPIVTVASL